MKRWLLALAMMAATPAAAETLVSTVSNPQVLITSSFDGATLSLFGSIEPSTPGSEATGPYNVVVVITGPLQDRVARIKTSNFGIWSNTDQVTFEHFPSFSAVISSGKLDTIANQTVNLPNSYCRELCGAQERVRELRVRREPPAAFALRHRLRAAGAGHGVVGRGCVQAVDIPPREQLDPPLPKVGEVSTSVDGGAAACVESYD